MSQATDSGSEDALTAEELVAEYGDILESYAGRDDDVGAAARACLDVAEEGYQ